MATSQFKFTLRNTSKHAINCAMNDWMLKDLKTQAKAIRTLVKDYRVQTS